MPARKGKDAVAARLADLRSEISALDRQLIKLIARRQKISDRIGRAKANAGMPVRNIKLEKILYSGFKQQAMRHGLPPDLIQGIYKNIISDSIRRQRACSRN